MVVKRASREQEQPDTLISVEAVERLLRQAGVARGVIDQVTTIAVGAKPELMTLREAAEHFGIPLERIRHWLYRGHLKEASSRTAPAPGGRVILVDANAVRKLLEDIDPKGGRPPKHRSR